MDIPSVNTILMYLNSIDVFMAIFCRFLGLVIIIPVISGQSIPNSVKIMISLALASIVMTTNTATMVIYDPTLFSYAIIIIMELITGFIIGFIVYFFMTIFYFVGQLVDFHLGFSMVSVFDPVSQLQVPITGNLYYFMATMFFVLGGGLHYFIQLTAQSFVDIPIGAANIVQNGKIISQLIDMMQLYLELGVKIALPVMGTILIVDVALGILVKAVPQMNVFVVGMPIKLLIGLVVVYMIMPLILDAYNMLIKNAIENVITVIRGMIP